MRLLPPSRAGFTLVELSIVLVILGLLIGGVLTGQSLIRASEIRSVASQYQRYQTAVMTFRDKYFAIPGDMNNATTYWGIAGGTGSDATCKGTASTDAKTCNGDGNASVSSAVAGSNESYRFWQHLANAGLIEGNYDGVQHGTLAYSSTTANSPSARISGGLWFTQDWGTLSAQTFAFDGVYGNYFEVGGYIVNNHPAVVIFKPEEVYNIDVKMDDGKPATGKIVIIGSITNCTTGTDSTSITASYNLASTGFACNPIFRQQF